MEEHQNNRSLDPPHPNILTRLHPSYLKGGNHPRMILRAEITVTKGPKLATSRAFSSFFFYSTIGITSQRSRISAFSSLVHMYKLKKSMYIRPISFIFNNYYIVIINFILTIKRMIDDDRINSIGSCRNNSDRDSQKTFKK